RGRSASPPDHLREHAARRKAKACVDRAAPRTALEAPSASDRREHHRSFGHRERLTDTAAHAAAEWKVCRGALAIEPALRLELLRTRKPAFVAVHDVGRRQHDRAAWRHVITERIVFERTFAEHPLRRVETHGLAHHGFREARLAAAIDLVVKSLLGLGMLTEKKPRPDHREADRFLSRDHEGPDVRVALTLRKIENGRQQTVAKPIAPDRSDDRRTEGSWILGSAPKRERADHAPEAAVDDLAELLQSRGIDAGTEQNTRDD